MPKHKLISIIIPIFNEEKNIIPISEQISNVFGSLTPYQYEIVFINDGSWDQSAKIIENIASKNRNIKYIEFSRNFGKEIATTAGIHIAGGDAAVIIDADLQHPPELIPEFIKKWEEGSDIVIGVRERSCSDSIVKKIGSKWFYRIANKICDIHFKSQETDFRLISRKVIDSFNDFTERNRITRGLIDWMGFKTDYISFQAKQRANGKAGYSNIKLFRLALSTFISHSLFPLKLAGYLGIFITFFSGAFGIFIFFEKYIFSDSLNLHFSGPAILAVIILFLTGIILSCLGLVALYIANIHNEVINRPIYIVKRRINLS